MFVREGSCRDAMKLKTKISVQKLANIELDRDYCKQGCELLSKQLNELKAEIEELKADLANSRAAYNDLANNSSSMLTADQVKETLTEIKEDHKSLNKAALAEIIYALSDADYQTAETLAGIIYPDDPPPEFR